MARRADPCFKPHGFDEPMPLPRARGRNGVYHGTATVREIPVGVTGADLARARGIEIAVGQIWLRGNQRVVIARLSRGSVWFREITHGRAIRHLMRWFFLSHAVPEAAIGRDVGGDE